MFLRKKKLKDGSIPGDGSLYDLGDGKVYQTKDGETFFPVGPSSILQSGCSEGVCSPSPSPSPNTMTRAKASLVKIWEDDPEPSFYMGKIFADIIGREQIKDELTKALISDKTLHTLLVGPPGCGKSEFLLKIKDATTSQSEFVDGSYGSKAGIVNLLLDKQPRYLLIDEIDKLEERDQTALFNLMEIGIVSKTLKSDRIEQKMVVTVFATANTDETLLPPLLSRFFAMYLREYTDEEFKELAVKSVAAREHIRPEVAMHIAVSVLRRLNSRDLRDVIKIAQRTTTVEEADNVVNTLIECSKENSRRE